MAEQYVNVTEAPLNDRRCADDWTSVSYLILYAPMFENDLTLYEFTCKA